MGSYLAKIKDISSYYTNISSVSLLYPVCVSPPLIRSFVVSSGTLAGLLGLLQDINLLEDGGPNLVRSLIRFHLKNELLC